MTDIDYDSLPDNVKELISRAEQNSPARQTEQALKTVMDEVQNLKNQMNPTMRLELDNLESALQPLLETMQFIADKENPETPDYSEPVVTAVSEMTKTLSASIAGLDLKPKINVAAPNVKVDAPRVDVDLSSVERVMKQIPAALEKAIAKIPKTEIPEQDNSELLDKLQEMVKWLESIDTASRIKPQAPSSIKVTNPDGSAISSGGNTFSTTIATNQISVGTSSTLIVAARTGRTSVTVTMLGAVDVYLGVTGVTTSTGTLLLGVKGASFTLNTSAAIYGVAASTVSVSYEEEY